MLFDVGRYDLLLDLLADWLIQDIEREAAAEQMCADATSIDQPLGAALEAPASVALARESSGRAFGLRGNHPSL
jgi:hypothetical protein